MSALDRIPHDAPATTTIGGSASQTLIGKGTIIAGSGTLVLGNSGALIADAEDDLAA